VERNKIERALEVVAVAVGLLLVIVGYLNFNTIGSGGCGRISCGPSSLYDPAYRLVFFIGIFAAMLGAIALTWNVVSHVGRKPPKG
jgi:hypothetical protein